MQLNFGGERGNERSTGSTLPVPGKERRGKRKIGISPQTKTIVEEHKANREASSLKAQLIFDHLMGV